MLVVAPHVIRVPLYCDRCDTWAVDHWDQKTGAREKPRRYAYSDEYKTLLDETRDAARLGLIAAGKPQPISAAMRKRLTTRPTQPTGDGDGKRTGLQLVSTRGNRGVRHAARGRKARVRAKR